MVVPPSASNHTASAAKTTLKKSVQAKYDINSIVAAG
jgi:hypothetical protein